MRKLATTLVAALLAGLGTFAPALAPQAAAATNPKVAIIVGATHDSTSRYRSIADGIAAVAQRYTTNVVKVYSPKATWSKVKSATNGASVIVYLGHGNGWPSPYTYDPNYTTKDGFGLNYDVNGNGSLSDYEVKYYGEPFIRELTPAKNAVVLLFHLCYASGNSEPGRANPTKSVAMRRADNFAAGFLRTGARAVFAIGTGSASHTIKSLFNSDLSMWGIFATDPGRNLRYDFSFNSTRTKGMKVWMDPTSPGRYYRAVTGVLGSSTASFRGD